MLVNAGFESRLLGWFSKTISTTIDCLLVKFKRKKKQKRALFQKQQLYVESPGYRDEEGLQPSDFMLQK